MANINQQTFFYFLMINCTQHNFAQSQKDTLFTTRNDRLSMNPPELSVPLLVVCSMKYHSQTLGPFKTINILFRHKQSEPRLDFDNSISLALCPAAKPCGWSDAAVFGRQESVPAHRGPCRRLRGVQRGGKRQTFHPVLLRCALTGWRKGE